MEVLLPPSKISTLITTAIRAGDSESLGRALTWQSTDLNIADEQGCFPLMAAIDAAGNNLTFVKLLLANGATPSRCKNILSAAVGAPSTDRLMIVKVLLENGADPSTNGAILHEVLAGAYFDKEKLKILHYNGNGDKEKATRKILEIETFRVEVALLLLQYGAKIDALSCTDQNIFAYQAHQAKHAQTWTSTNHMFEGSILFSNPQGSSATDVAFQLASHYLGLK
jgi:hypothetical protein